MNNRGFVAFYALTVLLILTLVAYGVTFSNSTSGTTIQYTMVESQARQALDAGMALALRIASTTTSISASYTFELDSGPCAKFSLNIETGSGAIVIATVSAVLLDQSDQEYARRRGRVLIQTTGPGANNFCGGWERF
ncbi:MAG: hypothetical protein ACOYM3_00175 [Terrimicrobiaceae bacterium]